MTKKWPWLIALAGLIGGNIACASAEEWNQVFSDEFKRSDMFGPDWEVKAGKWDLRENLKANGPGAVIMCTRRFEVPFRIEYECYSDNPCDLSIEFRKKLEDAPVCFVGFGSENNTLNKIIVPVDGDLARSKDKLIEVSRKHKVTVEAGEDGTVKQTVDGQETMKAVVKSLPKRLYFGFYVWNQGVFNSVNVFSPHSGVEAALEKKSTATGEKIPVVRQFQSFNDYALGAITGANMKAESGEKCSVKITDASTWLYCFRNYTDKNADKKNTCARFYDENEDPKIPEPNRHTVTNKGAHFVSDPCVELLDENEGTGKQAVITFPVPEMKKGLIEFDLMADHYEGDGIKIKLGDKAALWINKEGNYCWQTGNNTARLLESIHYHGLRGNARFYLQPQRWFTIRIDFDLESSLANVAVVRMFNGFKNPQEEYLLVGEDLPLPTDSIKEITLGTCGTGRFLVDNIFMISRTDDMADDTKWRVPAREIMTAYYPLRKDPFDLKIWSMHNIRFMGGSGTPTGDELQDLMKYSEQYVVILGCAEKYNKIMVKQAFLAEKMRGLERAWFYGQKTAGEYKAKIDEARQAAAKTEKMLDTLYKFYAECYLDRLNQEKMKEGFDKHHTELATAIENAEKLIDNTLETLRLEIIKKAQCKFEPYQIEPAESSGGRLCYSERAFRRDGKRDFVFNKENHLLWPSMEKTLLFPPDIGPGGPSPIHALRDIKEPEYYNPSTNAYVYQAMMRRPQEQMFIETFYGLHNNMSILPAWWVEKHSGDSDVFLQNSKAKSLIEKTRTGDSRPQSQAFNYWNSDVLAAQKATMEGLGDLIIKHGAASRIGYVNYAWEAYFSIAIPGGTWETGYNPTAVKAFQASLKKKYGDIKKLNELWGSKCGSFEEIKPPEDWRLNPEREPGLRYEFERFRQESWNQWLKQCHVWLQNRLPDGKNVPCSCALTMNGQTCVDGLNWTGLFETFDIVMEHGNQQFEQTPCLYRYLENLREANKSTTGIREWYVSAPDDLFNEEAIRNNGLRQTFQNVQWGRSVLHYWLGHNFCWLHNGNWTEQRLGHTVLRYSAAYIPLGITRAKSHRAIYLECPLLQPDVGIMESETSFFNVWDVRGGGNEFALLLCNKGYNYGNLFERLVMDGRQNLDDYKVIIMPNAVCLPEIFAEKLLGWVKAGGILLTTGAAGVMNEYGVQGGKLPDEVLGAGQWTYEKGKMSVKEGSPGLKVLAQDSSKQPALIEKEYGKGKVCMRLNPVKEDALYEIISRHAPRQFYGEGNKFHLAMRQGKDNSLYLSLLNPEVYQTLEDEIVLKGEYKDIADVSCNFPISPSIIDGHTRFKVRLEPAEGIMIRIRK